MIVVSDTSPLTALLTVGGEALLKQLFTEVVIPQAVHRELLRTHSVLPDWLRVMEVSHSARTSVFTGAVDVGEAEAIELALEIHADQLLMDERKGRRLAVQQGISVIGLVGVVLLARRRGLIPSARVILERMRNEAGAYFSDELLESALQSVGE